MEIVKSHFNITYSTANQYMSYFTLIKKCPGLCVSGLNFSQLTKYGKFICETLKLSDNESLLPGNLNIKIGSNVITMKSVDEGFPHNGEDLTEWFRNGIIPDAISKDDIESDFPMDDITCNLSGAGI